MKTMIDVVQRTIELYQLTGWKKWFAKIRFWDAPFEEIEKLLPKTGKIIDLGCGEGILVNYLALTGPRRKLIGIEKNRKRLKFAAKGLKNTAFFAGDVLKKSFPPADIILMVHLLHHLSSKTAQIELLKKARASLKKGGRLIIAEVDKKPQIKYLISWLTDAFIVPILFERKLYNFNFTYRKVGEWKRLLEKYGCKVNLQRADKNKPFSHVILVGKKK